MLVSDTNKKRDDVEKQVWKKKRDQGKGFFFVRKRPEKENIRKHRDFKMREDIGGPVTMKEYVCPSNGGGEA